MIASFYRGDCFPGSSAGKESACDAKDSSSIPGLGRCPEERIGCPLQYSGLENSPCIVLYSPWDHKSHTI